jgi:hypothetical protein
MALPFAIRRAQEEEGGEVRVEGVGVVVVVVEGSVVLPSLRG